MNKRERDRARIQTELKAAEDAGFLDGYPLEGEFLYDAQQNMYRKLFGGALFSAQAVDTLIGRAYWATNTVELKDKVKVVPEKPSVTLRGNERYLAISSSTWLPGAPTIMAGKEANSSGVMDEPQAICYNSYLPPALDMGEAHKATPWIDHVKMLYPEPLEHETIFNFLAHAVQRPGEKVNFGILLAGEQGIGKDAVMYPMREAVGITNFHIISPDDVMGRFNGHIMSVVLVVNEVRPHEKEFRADEFYDKLKALAAAPPEVLPLELKNQNMMYVENVIHLVMMTNTPKALRLPPDDRRLFMVTSPVKAHTLDNKEKTSYFNMLYSWLREDGTSHVAAWLNERDLSRFNAGEPAPITQAKRDAIMFTEATRSALVDLIVEDYCDLMAIDGDDPIVIFQEDLRRFVHETGFDSVERSVAAVRGSALPHAMDRRGYKLVHNGTTGNTKWRKGSFSSKQAYVRIDRQGNNEEIVRRELAHRPYDFKRIANERDEGKRREYDKVVPIRPHDGEPS